MGCVPGTVEKWTAGSNHESFIIITYNNSDNINNVKRLTGRLQPDMRFIIFLLFILKSLIFLKRVQRPVNGYERAASCLAQID